MGLETGDFIGDLVPAWPLGSDPKAEGADHLNLIKKVLQGSFGLMEGIWEMPGNNQLFRGETVGGTFVRMVGIDPEDLVAVGQGNVGTRIYGTLLASSTILAEGAVTANAGLTVRGGLNCIGGANTITGGLNLSNGLDVLSGGVDITGGCTATSFTAQSGIIVQAGGANITGGLTISGGFSSVQALDVNGLLQAHASLNLTGTLTQTGGQNITGAVSILGGNNLSVTGTTTSTGKLTVTSGGFEVGSGTTNLLGGGLNVSGAVNILDGNNFTMSQGGNASIGGGTMTVATLSGSALFPMNLNKSGGNAAGMILMNNANAGGLSATYGIFHRDNGELAFGQAEGDRGFVIHNIQAGVTRIIMDNLTTFDPNVTGALWNNNGVINISAG